MTTTTDDGKLDNMTVRRFAKLLKNGKVSAGASTPITTGKVVQNDNVLYVAVDDATLVPISYTNSNVSVGDTVTLSESAANFTYLEIYYRVTGTNRTNTKSVKVYSPNGKVVNLTDFYKATTTPIWQFLTAACTIKGTSITRENSVWINSNQSTREVSTGTNTNTGFAITRVVGIK